MRLKLSELMIARLGGETQQIRLGSGGIMLPIRTGSTLGTPEELKEQFEKLAASFQTEEIVMATFAESKEDRLESYELLARYF